LILGDEHNAADRIARIDRLMHELTEMEGTLGIALERAGQIAAELARLQASEHKNS
jgi:hypothetical protein